MTVAELIELLKAQKPTDIVIIATDSEGNEYKPLASLWSGSYDSDAQIAGFKELTLEDVRAGYGVEDLLEGEPAVILVPS